MEETPERVKSITRTSMSKVTRRGGKKQNSAEMEGSGLGGEKMKKRKGKEMHFVGPKVARKGLEGVQKCR